MCDHAVVVHRLSLAYAFQVLVERGDGRRPHVLVVASFHVSMVDEIGRDVNERTAGPVIVPEVCINYPSIDGALNHRVLGLVSEQCRPCGRKGPVGPGRQPGSTGPSRTR